MQFHWNWARSGVVYRIGFRFDDSRRSWVRSPLCSNFFIYSQNILVKGTIYLRYDGSGHCDII